MTEVQHVLKSKFGNVYLVASDEGLQGIYWEECYLPLTQKLNAENPAHQYILEAEQQLNEYFEGTRKTFDLKLNPVGTEFQKKVWSALRAIPFGEVVSYKDIARKIQHPKAVRAVGSANGRNPFSIVIPCHRVINAGGGMGGYAGGLENKKHLLALEGIEF